MFDHKDCDHKEEVVKIGFWRKSSKSFAEVMPHLVAECDGWDPRAYTSKSNYIMPWVCADCGYKWEAAIGGRSIGGGCPDCGKKKRAAAYSAFFAEKNNLARNFPKIAKQAHNWDPTKFAASSREEKEWLCDICQKVFPARIDHRTGSGSGCPECGRKAQVASRKINLAVKNNLAEKFPEIAKQAYNWNPFKYSAGSREKKEWLCDVCQNVFVQEIVNRTCNNNGCSKCSSAKRVDEQRRIAAKKNNLAEKFPELVSQCDGWQPELFSVSSNKIMPWVCACGYKWPASIASRTSGHGCKACAKYGYDENKSGFLYYLEDGGRRKYGITNSPEDRVDKCHQKNGFTPIQIVGPFCGKLVKITEQSIKDAIKAKSIPTGKDAFREQFDGYTESFNYQDLPANTLSELFVILGLEVPSFLSA